MVNKKQVEVFCQQYTMNASEALKRRMRTLEHEIFDLGSGQVQMRPR